MSQTIGQPDRMASATALPEEATSQVLVVIVNYRTPALVVDCLRSLEPEVRDVPGCQVVVVDGGSGDDSVALIGAAVAANGWQGWCRVMPLAINGGFAYANNAAIRAAMGGMEQPDFVMLLNPDTVIRPGAVRVLHEFLLAHPEAGIAGSVLEDLEGKLYFPLRRFPSPLRELEQAAQIGRLSRALDRRSRREARGSQPMPSDWVSGAAMMIRREVLDRVGYLDEQYFLYFEEVDLCARAARAGWGAWCVPASCVLHLEGQVTGITQPRRRRGRYWFDSRRRFLVKNYGALGLIVADVCWAIGHLILMTLRPQRHRAEPKYFALDLLGGDLKALATLRI